jgi:excisionase family DNA binding protein
MADELDLLSGAEAIAAYIGVKPRRIYHLAETRRLPVFRIGSTLCARRSTLLRWIEDMERAAIISEGHPLDGNSKG